MNNTDKIFELLNEYKFNYVEWPTCHFNFVNNEVVEMVFFGNGDDYSEDDRICITIDKDEKFPVLFELEGVNFSYDTLEDYLKDMDVAIAFRMPIWQPPWVA